MSADSTWDVQTAVFTKLSTDTALTNILADGAGGVLDHVPSEIKFPYVVIGETRSEPLDTMAISGYDVTLTIHTYSQGVGMSETRQIVSVIYNSLHNVSFNVANQILILCQLIDTETKLDIDGKTRHGIQRFQIITEPV